jgi:hypothetical protein
VALAGTAAQYQLGASLRVWGPQPGYNTRSAAATAAAVAVAAIVALTVRVMMAMSLLVKTVMMLLTAKYSRNNSLPLPLLRRVICSACKQQNQSTNSLNHPWLKPSHLIGLYSGIAASVRASGPWLILAQVKV